MDLATELRELIEVTATPDEVDTVLRQGLDWLKGVIPYDLATVFLLEEGTLQVRLARGQLASEAVQGHSVRLEEFPSLKDALESRRFARPGG